MTDISETEAKLESIREVYDDICALADEDGTRDDVELAMIARVDAKIKRLEAELRVAKARQTNEHDPKAAWEEVSGMYKDLLRLHANLSGDSADEADDLNVYLKAISSHLATEDWESAVNELLLALAWAKENELWSRYTDDTTEEEDNQREEDEDSGKTAWDRLNGDEVLEEARELHEQLVTEGSRHASKVGKFCDAIQKALDDEEWKKATTEAVLLDVYLRENDLYNKDEDEEGEEDEAWLARASDLAELTELIGQLVASGISGALDIAGTLAEITAAAASGDHEEAGRLLDDALVRAREMAERQDTEDEDPTGKPKKAWQEAEPRYRKFLKLHAELVKSGNSHAEDLNVHLQAIEAALATDDWATALNEVLLAEFLAQEELLWDLYEEEIEDEDAEEDASGKTIWDALEGDTLLAEHRALYERLDAQDNEHAARMKGLIDSIDTALSEENWKSATATMIILDKFVQDNDLETVADENGLSSRAMSELSSLVDDLTDAGAEIAAEITQTIQQITTEAAAGNFDTAQELLDDALDLARDAAEGIEELSRIDPSSASISASVGKEGRNDAEDVETVQRLLNRSGAGLVTDGDCGSKTIRAIESFQTSRLGWKDGRVDPGGKTFAALTGAAVAADTVDAVTDAVEDAADVVVDTAESVVETVTDMVEEAGDFLEDLFGGDDEEESTVREG